MKKADIFFITAIVLIFLPFIISTEVFEFYENINSNYGLLMSFVKFAILATLGEVIGLRVRKGVYNYSGFGIIPRAIVWGFLGLTIKMSFIIFSNGTISFIEYLGFQNVKQIMKNAITFDKVLIAFCISTTMNTIYAPIMMTIHKITDNHIVNNGGTVLGLFRKINIAENLKEINWNVQWNFVFKKTIPLFWIPAHTITFLLPETYQVLFAAILGIALGLILAIASLKSRK